MLLAVHLVASLAKRWNAAAHQGGIQPEHMGAYLDEFTFRFNRRHSHAPGMIFYRLIQAMIQASPEGYKAIALGLTPRTPRTTVTSGSHLPPRTLVLNHLDKPWRRAH